MKLIEGSDLAVSFGNNVILDGVDLAAEEGELIGLIGENGAGKTTLLRVLANLLPAKTGEVRFRGDNLHAFSRRAYAREMAYLPQVAVSHWPLEVRHLVALGRLPHLDPWQKLAGADLERIETVLRWTGTLHLATRTVTTLSGGEFVRVMLARALASEPKLLLADEPVASLDPFHQLQVMELLRDIAKRGACVLVVLHDLALAARFCDRLLLLHAGRVMADGAPEAVLTPSNLKEAYGIVAEFGERDGTMYLLPWCRLDTGLDEGGGKA
ncbi:MAG: ABC transporter ATP-binding protein [Alphaproteobacteria bacterium]|nr:ABC transporter ATP-binding protein [Alphaproteobacteria bacterium]